MTTSPRSNARHLLYDPWARRADEGIDRAFYDSVIKSDRFISHYIAFEEAIVGIRYAMYDFEKFLLTISLDYEENRGSDHSYFQDMRIRANGRVVSVLNAITSFRNQFPMFKETSKQLASRDVFLENWRLQRESDVNFDFCEVLRNYAAHQTQPVSRVTVGGEWDKAREWRESHASIFVTVHEVCTSRHVSAAQRERFLTEFGQRADVSIVLRNSMDCIGDVAREMRSWLNSDFDQSCSTYAAALSTAPRSEFGYLILVREGDENSGRQIFPEFMNYAKKLRAGHLPGHTARGYVSNRARGHSSDT